MEENVFCAGYDLGSEIQGCTADVHYDQTGHIGLQEVQKESAPTYYDSRGGGGVHGQHQMPGHPLHL